MEIKRGGISHNILAFLLSARSTSRYKRLLGSDLGYNFKDESYRTTISRLYRNKYLDKKDGGWIITQKGKASLERVTSLYITSPFDLKSTKNTLVAFDIPEMDRKTRNWIRNQLKIFNYEILQKSLWFGPGPLPKEFLQRLVNLNIKDNVKIFTIKQKQ